MLLSDNPTLSLKGKSPLGLLSQSVLLKRRNDSAVFGHRSLVAANCALSKSRKRALQLRFVAAPLSRKSHGFARVLGRKLRFGRNDKMGVSK